MVDQPQKAAASAKPQKARLYWGDGDHLEQIMVDHAQLQSINDQFYLTFGQTRTRVIEGAPPEPLPLEIRPMARVVLSMKAMSNLVSMLKKHIGEESK